MTIEETDQTIPKGRNRRNPWRLFSRWFSQKMPKGLYARALIIIIAPMVLLQSVIAFVFMERHWQTVTQRLSQVVTSDIAAVIDIIENYPQDAEFEQITKLAAGKTFAQYFGSAAGSVPARCRQALLLPA